MTREEVVARWDSNLRQLLTDGAPIDVLIGLALATGVGGARTAQGITRDMLLDLVGSLYDALPQAGTA